MEIPIGYLFHLIILLFTCTDGCAAIRWLALAHSDQKYFNSSTLQCKILRADGLNSHQVKFCKKNTDLMPRVMHAAKETVVACEHVFKERRWNCSTVNRAPNFLPDLTSGTREQAYLYALSGSAVAAAFARACALGVFDKCSCAKYPNIKSTDKFKWGGCGDHVEFGVEYSAAFTDSKLPASRSKKAIMSMHNYRTGRKFTADSLRKTCKCHGVSGSCATQTCWMALPEMPEIAKNLKEKYALAVEVKNKKIRGRRNLLPLNPGRGVTDEELIYYTTSPDYCSYDKATGSVGTVGRHCIKDGENGSNCDTMCCGRGFRTYSYWITERCHCKYVWCCYVKCKLCDRKITINECL